jgi:hypothetical protein
MSVPVSYKLIGINKENGREVLMEVCKWKEN